MKCPVCGSKEIRENLKLYSVHSVIYISNPDYLRIKYDGKLYLNVCTDCGYVMLKVQNPQDLKPKRK